MKNSYIPNIHFLATIDTVVQHFPAFMLSRRPRIGCGAGGPVPGIVTERDILLRLVAQGLAPGKTLADILAGATAR